MIIDQYAFGSLGRRIRKVFSATFRRENETKYKEYISNTVSGILLEYTFISPFCRSMCPACPYVREMWGDGVTRAYISALKDEIKMVGRVLDLKVVDIHVG